MGLLQRGHCEPYESEWGLFHLFHSEQCGARTLVHFDPSRLAAQSLFEAAELGRAVLYCALGGGGALVGDSVVATLDCDVVADRAAVLRGQTKAPNKWGLDYYL